MAEWSKALVLGTSHFGGVGSNPTTIKRNFKSKVKNEIGKNSREDIFIFAGLDFYY